MRRGCSRALALAASSSIVPCCAVTSATFKQNRSKAAASITALVKPVAASIVPSSKY